MSIPIRADVLNLLGIYSDAVPFRARELQVDLIRERTAGHGVSVESDLIIGLNKLKTQNLLIKEEDSLFMTIRDISDTYYRGLDVRYLWCRYRFLLDNAVNFRHSVADPTVYYVFQSYDGTAWVDNLKFGGGIVEINQGKLVSDLDEGKLVSDLDAGGYTIKNIEMYEADYGGGFATFTPPALKVGALFLARDTNATTPGWRLYAGFSDGWHYVDLT